MVAAVSWFWRSMPRRASWPSRMAPMIRRQSSRKASDCQVLPWRMTIVRASPCSRDGSKRGRMRCSPTSRDRSACSFLAMRVPRDRSGAAWASSVEARTVRPRRPTGQERSLTGVGWLTCGTLPEKLLCWRCASLPPSQEAHKMKERPVISGRTILFSALALPVLLATAGVAAEGPSWRFEKGDVKIVVPLKPGGAFVATTSALTGTLTLEGAKPARLVGDVFMDLSTIDTGIALRNQHLKENYLEVAKGEGYNRAVLSEIQLAEATGESFD